MERLQKIIAAAGLASRRHAEEMILAGRVSLNGAVVRTLGTKADAARDHIRVDGKLLHGAQQKAYIVLNKPKGYVTTLADPEGRPTVMQLIRQAASERLYPVGRLDWNSEGLLLLTNDGELANALMRAASHVAKTYQVKVSGQPTPENIQKLREGVRIGGAPRKTPRSANDGEPGPAHFRHAMKAVTTAPAQIRLLRSAENPWYEVTLHQGRNRQLHRMFEAIGHHVEKIRRVRYGPLALDLQPGEFRRLTEAEINALRRAVQVRPSADSRAKGRNTKER